MAKLPNEQIYLFNRASQMVQVAVDTKLENRTAAEVLTFNHLIMCKGRRLKNIHLDVIKAEGAAATVSVGTVADPVAFLDSVDVNAVAQYLSLDTAAVLFDTDTQIIITINNNMSEGQFSVKALFDDFKTTEILFTQLIK
ncbi:hypothetical protein DRJ16_02870 [Candidatus Woesearchaeota archaeon]|nr:MAG: hypothetical protein DRJ16_02870 [Candidatus Woesearchaeota archaeon]